MADIPQPPISSSNEELHRALTDIITFLRDRNEQGVKFRSFTQAEINSFTDLSYFGTVLANSTTNEANVSYIDGGGNIMWRPF